MAHSTLTKRGKKPEKPRPDFPLFPHATGRWPKKVRGKFSYVGKVADDPKGESAVKLWLDQRDDLLAGRTPRVSVDGLTVRDLCNRFLTAKEQQREAGDITPRSFADYFATCQFIVQRPTARPVKHHQLGQRRMGSRIQIAIVVEISKGPIFTLAVRQLLAARLRAISLDHRAHAK